MHVNWFNRQKLVIHTSWKNRP